MQRIADLAAGDGRRSGRLRCFGRRLGSRFYLHRAAASRHAFKRYIDCRLQGRRHRLARAALHALLEIRAYAFQHVIDRGQISVMQASPQTPQIQ
jgi:hypothetical protein